MPFHYYPMKYLRFTFATTISIIIYYILYTFKNNVGGAMHFIYYVIIGSSIHESGFNLFGLLNKVAYMSVAEPERIDHRVGSQRIILSRHTGHMDVQQ